MTNKKNLFTVDLIAPNKICAYATLPKFEEFDTQEFKDDVKELDELGRKLSGKLAHIFDTYTLPCTCGKCKKKSKDDEINKDLERFIKSVFGIK